jgi:GH24 family phage-related lysozyme (muramidase)
MGWLDPYLPQIQGFEGYSPRAQWDYKQWTNGYGTRALYPGEVIDRDTAAQRFNTEIGNSQTSVDKFSPDAPTGLKAALTDLTYNAGSKWQGQGLGKAVLNGDYDAAKNLLLGYNRAGGQFNRGLFNRRSTTAGWINGGTPANTYSPSELQGLLDNPAPQTNIAQNGAISGGALPPGMMGLGGPKPDEDAPPMGKGLLSAGSNMAKFLPPQSPPPPMALGGPPPASASGGGLFGSLGGGSVGDSIGQALANPGVQFGLAMAGAGGEGKGLGGGVSAGAQGAANGYKYAQMAREQKFINELQDPNSATSKALGGSFTPAQIAIARGMPSLLGDLLKGKNDLSTAAAIAQIQGNAQVSTKNAELEFQRRYDRENMQSIMEMMKKQFGQGGDQPPPGARQAADGKYYVPDPARPGKYQQWVPN